MKFIKKSQINPRNVKDNSIAVQTSGEITLDAITHVLSEVQSQTPTTGAMNIAGGIGIVGNTHVGGDFVVHNTSSQTKIDSQSVIISGSTQITGNVVLTGDLQVTGTTVSVNSTTLDVADKTITIAKGSTDAAASDGAGIAIEGANASITYDFANDQFVSNKKIQASEFSGNFNGTVSGTISGDTTGLHTGDVVGNVTGNVTGNASTATGLQTSHHFSISGDATASNVFFDGTSDVDLQVTLSNTGVIAGTYGSANSFASFTIGTDGRLTGAEAHPISVPVNSVFGREGDILLTASDVTDALAYTPVKLTGDIMTGPLVLPANGLTVGDGQLSIIGSNVVVGSGALGINSTDGYLYIPSTGIGAPIATPTEFTGRTPLIVDADGNMYVYSGGLWKTPGISGSTAWASITGTPTTVAGYGITDSVSKTGDTLTGTLHLPANGLDVGSNQLVVVGGNVGINTTTPGSKLEVAGQIHSSIGGFKFPDASIQTTAWNGNQTITLTGDASGAGNTDIVVTLSDVNLNVGMFGSSSMIPKFTVNSKGLITAVTTSNIEIAADQVTSGTFADSRISSSSVTQYQSSLLITEDQVNNGSLLARNADNEIITGNWSFTNPVIGVTPTDSVHLANKSYVDSTIYAAIAPLASTTYVDAAIAAASSTSGALTASSVSLADGGITSLSLALMSNSPNQVVDSIPIIEARVVEYLIQVTSGTDCSATKIIVMHNGTSAYIQVYGQMSSNLNLALFDANIVSGNLELTVTPTNMNTTIRAIRTAIAA